MNKFLNTWLSQWVSDMTFHYFHLKTPNVSINSLKSLTWTNICSREAKPVRSQWGLAFKPKVRILPVCFSFIILVFLILKYKSKVKVYREPWYQFDPVLKWTPIWSSFYLGLTVKLIEFFNIEPCCKKNKNKTVKCF